MHFGYFMQESVDSYYDVDKQESSWLEAMTSLYIVIKDDQEDFSQSLPL